MSFPTRNLGPLAKLGFGGLFSVRNPKLSSLEVATMVDEFIGAGFTCFDSAFAYGAEEELLRDALVSRYPRDAFELTQKITAWKLESKDDVTGNIEKSLQHLGTSYFDYLMLHNVSLLGNRLRTYEELGAWEAMIAEKEAGRARSIGISFHDSSHLLREVLDAHPEIDFVMLPINYLDWEDDVIQGRKNYEVAREFGKPIMVMKPLNGGLLVKLPPKAKAIIEKAGVDPASLAYRFCASLEGVTHVFSTMDTVEHASQDIDTYRTLGPLTPSDCALIEKITRETRGSGVIECSHCGYCMATCPRGVKVPWIFSTMNMNTVYDTFSEAKRYYNLHTKAGGKASECIGCRRCNEQCPQKLDIVDLLGQAAILFESGDR